jgi:hypothetical protein
MLRATAKLSTLVLIGVGLAGCGHAHVASTFSELQTHIAPDQTLSITARDGSRTTGKLVSIAGTSLTLRLPDSAARQFAQSDVARIRSRDSLWNGLLIGAAVGGLPFALLADEGCTAPNAVPDCVKVSRGEAIALTAGIGAVLGAGLDFAHRKRVFESAAIPRVSVTLSPAVSPRRVGITLTARY